MWCTMRQHLKLIPFAFGNSQNKMSQMLVLRWSQFPGVQEEPFTSILHTLQSFRRFKIGKIHRCLGFTNSWDCTSLFCKYLLGKEKSNGDGELDGDRLLTKDIRLALYTTQNCHPIPTIMLRSKCPTLKVKCYRAIVSLRQIPGSTVPEMALFL